MSTAAINPEGCKLEISDSKANSTWNLASVSSFAVLMERITSCCHNECKQAHFQMIFMSITAIKPKAATWKSVTPKLIALGI